MVLDSEPREEERGSQLVWRNIWKFLVLHAMFLHGLSLVPGLAWPSLAWLAATYLYSGAGITAGAHRLWSHTTYKARLPLRYVVICWDFSVLGEGSKESQIKKSQKTTLIFA